MNDSNFFAGEPKSYWHSMGFKESTNSGSKVMRIKVNNYGIKIYDDRKVALKEKRNGRYHLVNLYNPSNALIKDILESTKQST